MTDPTDVDGWAVGEKIGFGSFADVYRVSHDGVARALKICRTLANDCATRLDMERAALETLSAAPEGPAPRVPRFFGHGVSDGRPYLLMSLVPGIPLDKAIQKREADGLVFGDIEAMRVLRGLLEALVGVHRSGLTHRDVKDANVLLDPATGDVTLIDFGFCKRTGHNETVSDDSFVRVGAQRYCPPSKLEDPPLADPKHDLFAAGVVGYRLLTGRYPWEAPEGAGWGALRTAMQEERLVPAREYNSRILAPISSLISRLLIIDDHRRPSASAALTALNDVVAAIPVAPPGRPLTRVVRLAYPNKIRDPLYGDVRLTSDEWRILDTPQMQRLRSLKQLGLTDVVYPGATHTRLSHSIGRLARVEQILVAAEQKDGIRVDEEIRVAARLYALTRDVTVVPFGNAIEDELGLFRRHDRNNDRARRLVGETAVGDVLAKLEVAPEAGRIVLAHLLNEASGQVPVVAQLVTGEVGADVLDYVNRDAYYCGLDNRIDSAIFRQYVIQGSDRLESFVGDNYGLRVDREFAVESLLRERYAMFLKVYTHRSKAAASALLGVALTRALAPDDDAPAYLTEAEIERLRDETLVDRLADHPSGDVRRLMNDLRERRLPRGVYRGLVMRDRPASTYENRRRTLEQDEWTTASGRAVLQRSIAERVGVDPDHIYVHCPARAPGYRLVEHWVSSSPTKAATPQPMFESLTELHLNLWEMWVFVDREVPSTLHRAVGKESQEVLRMSNLIERPRQDRAHH